MRVCIRVGDPHDKQSMTEPEGTADTPAKKKRSRIVTVIAWFVAGLLVPACGAWVIGRGSYWFDVIASQQMLISWAALVVTIVVLLTRRKAPAMVCAVLVVVSFYPVLTGRVWSLPSVDLAHKPDDVIRIVSCNINPLNEQWVEGVYQLLDLDADVVVLIELSPEMSRSVRNRGAIDQGLYPYRSFRHWVQREVSAGVVFSRWPSTQAMKNETDNQNTHYRRIEHPLGDFIVGLVHPLSPRTKERWLIGNGVVQSHRSEIDQGDWIGSLPLIVCADLNAGPAQQRAGTLRSTGLRMSKPVLKMDGSFPAGSSVPAVLRVQLDDVWSRGDLKPIAWSLVPVPGSDHLAVVVDFEAR